jgi:hypothetical protein
VFAFAALGAEEAGMGALLISFASLVAVGTGVTAVDGGTTLGSSALDCATGGKAGVMGDTAGRLLTMVTAMSLLTILGLLSSTRGKTTMATRTKTAAPIKRCRARWCSGSSVNTESSPTERALRPANLVLARDRVSASAGPVSGCESRLNSWDRRIMN